MDNLKKLELIKKVMAQATLTSKASADPGVPVVARKWLVVCLTEATGEVYSLSVINLLFSRFARTLKNQRVAIKAHHGSRWLRLSYVEKFIEFCLSFQGHTEELREYARYWAKLKDSPKGPHQESPIEALFQANLKDGLYDGLIKGSTYARTVALRQSAIHFQEAQKAGPAVLVLGSQKVDDCKKMCEDGVERYTQGYYNA